jgi:large subunit ribosomal protein L25
MKLRISPRKNIENPSKTITLTKKRGQPDGMPGPNEIAKRKRLNRENGAPSSAPGSSQNAEIAQIRKNGDIPAVLYGAGVKNERVFIKGADEGEVKGFHAVMRDIKRDGYLATTIFELVEGKKKHKAIIKEIQYNKVSYQVEHIDFLCLEDDKPVTLNVPIEILGKDDCKGIKAGGFPRIVTRALKVTCLPSQIVKSVEVDITDLDMPVAKAPDAIETGPRLVTSKSVKDLVWPATWKVKTPLNQIVVAIAKK